MRTAEEILEEAIQGEIESNELYTRAVGLVHAEHIKSVLRDLAEEELRHKAALENLLANIGQLGWEIVKIQAAPVEDYQITDHLIVHPLEADSTFQDVCIFAARKEQQSYELYRDLAEQSSGEIRDLLVAMSKDELRHKNLVEGWYEEVVYQEF